MRARPMTDCSPRRASADCREPLLWHARFLPADRSEIEQKVLTAASKDAAPADRRGQIAVATQVGEQSLDLDFDALISDLAPIDTLIQRIGRTRRHRRDAAGGLKRDGADERPNLPITILAPDPREMRPDWYRALLPRASGVYRDDAQLWLGLTHLLDPETIPGRRRSGPIVLDHDLKPLIESVYADEEDVAARVPAALRPALDAAAGRATEFRRAGQKIASASRRGWLLTVLQTPSSSSTTMPSSMRQRDLVRATPCSSLSEPRTA